MKIGTFKICNELLFYIFFIFSGECGKSTILKQMKILHKGGFTPEEKIFYVNLLHTNVFDTVIRLCKLCPDLLESKLNQHDAAILFNVCFINYVVIVS